MKKILLVAPYGFSKTGVPTLFMTIVRNLAPLGFSFDVIYFDKTDLFYLNEFLSYGGSAFFFGRGTSSRWAKKIQRYVNSRFYYVKARKLLQEFGPYFAVHVFKEFQSAPILMAAYKERIPLRIYHSNNVIQIAGNLLNKCLMKKEKNECFRCANVFVSCSEQAFSSAFGEQVPHIVINNPYDEKHYFFSSNIYPIEGSLSLVQTGIFSSGKNQLFTLEVVAFLKRYFPCVVVHFIGQMTNRDYFRLVKEKITQLGLSRNVVFHSSDCEQKKVFDSCHYFILPSKNEAFGIVLIEAQACGLKCFASTAVPETANVGGCVRIPLDLGAEEWAKRIYNDFLLARPKQKYDCSPFSEKQFVEKIVSVYSGSGVVDQG